MAAAMESGHLAGDGPNTRICEQLLEEMTGAPRVLLTSSCTHALEMAFMLADVGPGDEVIIPCFTFVSVANAVVLRGARPVFVDSDPADLNVAVDRVAAAIRPQTKAVVVMHYGGIAADLEALASLLDTKGIPLIEDAAHCIGASWQDQALGTFGAVGTLSFHATKNIHCGEGGALLINRPDWMARAEQIREKGTNRKAFERGSVAAYTWVTAGSSYLLSELSAAFLKEQLAGVPTVNAQRNAQWQRYQQAFREVANLQLPVIRPGAAHNGHIYFIRWPTNDQREACRYYLREHGISARFHYQPLSESPAGKRWGRKADTNEVAIHHAHCLLRLPIYPTLSASDQDYVIHHLIEFACKC